MIGALLVGLVAGIIGRMLIPFDYFRKMRGPLSWLASIVLPIAPMFLRRRERRASPASSGPTGSRGAYAAASASGSVTGARQAKRSHR
jgi:hypothetical protein